LDALEFHKDFVDFAARQELPHWKLYAVARIHDLSTEIFPDEYEVLDVFDPEDMKAPLVDDYWLQDWIEMWPDRKKLDDFGAFDSYVPRPSYKAADRKMRSYLRSFNKRHRLDFSYQVKNKEKRELITKATALYLTEKEADNWAYTMKATNFIEKDGDSTLEKYIRSLLNQRHERPSYYIN
jgi:hypothetical protein